MTASHQPLRHITDQRFSAGKARRTSAAIKRVRGDGAEVSERLRVRLFNFYCVVMLSPALLSVFLSHFFDDFSVGTTRLQRAANFYKRFFFSPYLSLLQKTRKHLCKGHGRGRISISTRHEHLLPRSLITRANPIRLQPTGRPTGPRGRKKKPESERRKKSKLHFAHPMVTRTWRPCSPACVPCDDITASRL